MSPAPPPAEGPVLALDTTGSLGSVAVAFARGGAEPEEVVVETFEPSVRHAANLLSAIRRALARAGVGVSDLALVAATRGPGSFTGLRVGLATVQGLALGAGIPGAGVSSLDAAALTGGDSALRRLALVDALRGELFGAVYYPGERLCPLLGPLRLLPAETPAFAAKHGVERICGPGAARYAAELASAIPVAAEPLPLAPAILRLALRGGGSSLEPIYLRDPDIHSAGAPPARAATLSRSSPAPVVAASGGSPEVSMNQENPIEPDSGAASGERDAAPDLEVEELIRQHRELDERLKELARAPHLTPSQQHDELVMKKRKLALKDRIAALAPS